MRHDRQWRSSPEREVRSALVQLGVEEISPVFVFPDRVRYARIASRTLTIHLRYPVRGVRETGTAVFLRSHGTDFNIVPPEWLGAGLGLVFSIGRGLDSELQERSLLLLQAIGNPHLIIPTLQAVVAPHANSLQSSSRDEYDLPCIRVSALLSRAEPD